MLASSGMSTCPRSRGCVTSPSQGRRGSGAGRDGAAVVGVRQAVLIVSLCGFTVGRGALVYGAVRVAYSGGVVESAVEVATHLKVSNASF